MKNQLLALALMTAGFVSCTDDSYDLENISNDFRIGLNEYLPIASSEVKLKDILSEFKNDYISQDADGLLIFKFDTVNRVMVKPIEVAFKETSFEYDLLGDGNFPVQNMMIPGSAPDVYFSFPVNLSVDDENGAGRIDEIHIKSGEFRFRLESENVDLSNLFIRGIEGLDINRPIYDKETNTIEYSLDDKIINFPEGGFVLSCQVGVIDSSKNVQIKGNDAKIKIVMEESSLTYHKIKGAFKSNVEQIENTDFYINLYDDNIDFNNLNLNVVEPTLKITGRTNSGIPLKCSVKSLVGKHKTKKAGKKDSVEAVFKVGGYQSKYYDFEFKQSTKENEEVQAFHAEFNNDNGKLDEIFNYLPDSVFVKCGIRINADPDPANNISYFLFDSTYVDLDIVAEVPLHIGDGSQIIIRDTVDGIDIVKDVEDYQKGNFKFDNIELFIEFENELPFEAVVNAKFCKADTAANGDVVITHLEDTELDQVVKIPAAKIGNDGYLQKSTPSKKKIVLSDDMVEDIKKINAVDFTYKIKVPSGTVDGVFLTNKCGLSAKVYTHLKANISKTEK